MSGSLIDLADYRFWVVVLIAYVTLTLCPGGKYRRALWACVNLGFITMLWARAGVAVLVGSVIVYGLLSLLARLKRARPLLLVVAAIGCAGFLVHKLPQLAVPLHMPNYTRIASLVGLSFVVLRLVEVFRAVAERRHPVPDIASLVNFIFPFHMLAAGPIQSYDDFISQPEKPAPLHTRDVLQAVERITRGMFKKYFLALVLQKVVLNDFSSGGFYFFLEMQIFFLWLYLDFSAYSDVAVGIGKLIGVATPENFNRPYLARNVMDFWERWHISLSQFIRRNLFIPLQMYQLRRWENLPPALCASIAFAVSFLLCGVWHSLSWSFFLWGAMHATGLIVVNFYRLFLQRKLGGKGVQRYLQIPWVRWLSTFATYEFMAFSLVPLFL